MGKKKKNWVWSDFPCEEVDGWVNSGGYVRVYSPEHKRPIHPHIEACIKANGPRPSKKHKADHLCENKKCSNPHHMRWLTNALNVKRGYDSAQERTKRTRKTDAEVMFAVDQVRNAGRSMEDVAKEMGISYKTMGHWMTGYSRSNLTGFEYNPRPEVVYI